MTLLRRLCGFLLMTAIDFFCTDGSHAQHYSSFVICVLTFSTSSSWGIEAETCKGSKSFHSLDALPLFVGIVKFFRFAKRLAVCKYIYMSRTTLYNTPGMRFLYASEKTTQR